MPSFKSLRSCSICAWPIRPLPLMLRVVTGSFPGRWLESRNDVKPRCAPSLSPAPSSAPGVAVCSGISRLSPRASGAAWLLRPLPSLLGLTLPVSAALSLTSVKLLTMSTMASLTLPGPLPVFPLAFWTFSAGSSGLLLASALSASLPGTVCALLVVSPLAILALLTSWPTPCGLGLA